MPKRTWKCVLGLFSVICAFASPVGRSRGVRSRLMVQYPLRLYQSIRRGSTIPIRKLSLRQFATMSTHSRPNGFALRRSYEVSTSPEVMENLRQRYAAADLDGDSWLNKEELRSVLECTDSFCLNKHWLPMEMVESIMIQYDKENLGRIGFEEFIDLALDKQLLEGKLDEYLEAFEAIDKDGNGYIELSEMEEFLRELGSSTEEIEQMFKAGDLNQDNKIEFGEFLGLVRSKAVDLQSVLKYLEIGGLQADRAAKKFDPPVQGEVNMISGKTELDKILETSEKPVILMIAFHWCRPCKGFSKKYERFADSLKDEITFLKVYGEENEDTKAIVKALAIKASPSFCIFDKGEVAVMFKGANEEKFRTQILEFQNKGVDIENQ